MAAARARPAISNSFKWRDAGVGITGAGGGAATSVMMTFADIGSDFGSGSGVEAELNLSLSIGLSFGGTLFIAIVIDHPLSALPARRMPEGLLSLMSLLSRSQVFI
jgi:hypothetical protein